MSASSSSSSSAAASARSTAASAGTPPAPALLAYESVRFTHRLQYAKEDVYGYLTTHRLLLLHHATGKLLFAIPLSIVTGHNISAPKSPQCMMRIAYVPPAGSAGSEAGATKHAVLVFTGPQAFDERQQWKAAIAEVQIKNTQSSTAAPVAPEAEQSVTVKQEPTNNKASAASSPAVKPAPTPASPSTPPASTTTAAPSPATTTASPSASSATAASPPPTTAPSPTQPPSTTTISLSMLETRASLLARMPHLKQLHTDLVLKHILTEEEFWASPSHSELIRKERDASTHQQAGLSSAMAAEIAPSAVSASSVHFKVDANIMHAIFLHSPAVHRAYQQLVPTKMTEKEFWTKYFRSRYVHAGRAAMVSDERGKAAGSDEVKGGDTFTRTVDEAERVQEEEEGRQYGPNERRVKSLIASKHIDPSVDLTSADADEAVMTGQPGILNHDHSVSESGKGGGRLSKKSRAQMELLRKYNRHGMLVLDTTAGRSTSTSPHTTISASAAEQSTTNDQLRYHQQLNDSLTFTDLQEEVAVEYEVLPLQRKGFFAESGGSGAAGRGVKGEDGEEESNEKAVRSFNREVSGWRSDVVRDALPMPSQALVVLQEVSIASRAMNRAATLTEQIHARQQTTSALDADSSLAASEAASSSSSASSSSPPAAVIFSTTDGSDSAIPDLFQQQLRKHFVTCQELFRHFYACFPVATDLKRSKLLRIKLAIDSAYQGLLLLKGDCNRQGQAVLVPLLQPLMSSVETCHSLYVKWQEADKLKQSMQQRQQAASPAASAGATGSADANASAKRVKLAT